MDKARTRKAAPRLRALFLRFYRQGGEVKGAAEQAGVALSTLYRWRERDAAFRARWESLAEQRRQMVEDRLMRLVNEGEKVAVFYKGEQVGWKVSHTPRAAIAMLACLERREKAREKADRKQQKADLDSRFDADRAPLFPARSRSWDEIPHANEEILEAAETAEEPPEPPPEPPRGPLVHAPLPVFDPNAPIHENDYWPPTPYDRALAEERLSRESPYHAHLAKPEAPRDYDQYDDDYDDRDLR